MISHGGALPLCEEADFGGPRQRAVFVARRTRSRRGRAQSQRRINDPDNPRFAADLNRRLLPGCQVDAHLLSHPAAAIV